MKFQVIPNEQTPPVYEVQKEYIGDYIEKFHEELLAFLWYATTRNDAVGLAANQCAVDGERFFMRAFALGGRERNWRLIIHPVITKYIGIKEFKGEGCLTWKNKMIVAERSRAVEVSYYDIDGNFHEGEIYKGFDGQIWQHEINHLNGVEEDVRDFFAEPLPIHVGRNEPCPCGALDLNKKRKKYKKCCLLLI